MEYLATFHTHFDALQYGKFLKKRKEEGRLQPVPRSVSSSCGTCVKFRTDCFSAEHAAQEFDCIFRIEQEEYILIMKKD